MIKIIDELPNFRIGDLIQGARGKFVITNILQVMVEDPADEEPTVTFKILLEQITDNEEN